MARTYTLTVDGRRTEAEIWQEDGDYMVRIGPTVHIVSVDAIGDGRLLSFLIDGRCYEVHATVNRNSFDLLVRNELFHVETQAGGGRGEIAEAAGEAGPVTIRSPMTGIVAEVLVSAGAHITRGAVTLILESMKMKNELRAHLGGTVTRVEVTQGQQVERGQPLLQIDSDPE